MTKLIFLFKILCILFVSTATLTGLFCIYFKLPLAVYTICEEKKRLEVEITRNMKISK